MKFTLIVKFFKNIKNFSPNDLNFAYNFKTFKEYFTHF